MSDKLSYKRYLTIFVPTMGLYMLATLGISWGEKNLGFSDGTLYALAIIPIAAFLIAMWGHWRYINELDEYLLDVQVRSIMVGIAIAMSVSVSWGTLEGLANAPRLDVIFVFVIFCVGYSAATMVLTFLNRRRGHEE